MLILAEEMIPSMREAEVGSSRKYLWCWLRRRMRCSRSVETRCVSAKQVFTSVGVFFMLFMKDMRDMELEMVWGFLS
jgi:hypothetical protein